MHIPLTLVYFIVSQTHGLNAEIRFLCSDIFVVVGLVAIVQRCHRLFLTTMSML